MRILFDANVLISYLLTSDKQGTISSLIETAFIEGHTLILPQELLEEVREKIRTKPYLADKISQDASEMFITSLKAIGEQVPPLSEVIPVVGRDRKDDYLLAQAVIHEPAYLVTGDVDLLIIEQIQRVKIVSPTAFLKILNNRS